MNTRAACVVETNQACFDGSVVSDQSVPPAIAPQLNTIKERGNGLPEQAPQPYLGLERLICAALADAVFAAALIANPVEALATSTHDNLLTQGERVLVCSVIGASDIHDYAARLHAITYPHRPNGFG